MAVYSTLGDLQRDMETAATEFKPLAEREVASEARDGNTMGKRLARQSAGRHGVHYPTAWSAERMGALSWEWGPVASMPQGDMSFEEGSRNQPPHHDKAKAADAHGAAQLGNRIQHRVFPRLFWAGRG